MKYLVHYGNGNKVETDSRNARQWARDVGESVTITNNSGKFICRAVYVDSDTIVVSTVE